ncbi:hypothetical protein L1887_50650 [Cichorium endivia]|nr:hypothetical protein L1887_50650 [Cichorium endivia]
MDDITGQVSEHERQGLRGSGGGGFGGYGQADGRLPSLGRAIWACGDACGLIGLDWVRNAPHASHARPAARHSDSALSSQSESPPRLATPRRASPCLALPCLALPCLALPCLTSHRIHPNQRSFASDPTRSLSASFAHIHIHIQRCRSARSDRIDSSSAIDHSTLTQLATAKPLPNTFSWLPIRTISPKLGISDPTQVDPVALSPPAAFRHVATKHLQIRRARRQKLHQGLFGRPGQGARCHLQRPLGPERHTDERAGAAQLQPERVYRDDGDPRQASQRQGQELEARLQTLKEFQYIDETGKDQGANVRQKAKDITNLLQDEARLRDERRSRSHMRDRMSNGAGDDDDEARRRRAEQERRRRPNNNEDDELRRAIEESKRMAQQEQDRIRAEAKDEEELQRALALSKKEEEERIKALEDANKNALFDDSINLDGANAYTQNQQVDFFGNPLVDTSGSQNYGVQPQYTSFNPYMQMQPTGYNPFMQNQLQQQELMQQQYMQQQQAEYQRQLELQQAAVQYQNLMTQQQQPLVPQQTSFGSNNPWLQSGGQQQQQQQHNVPVGDLFSSAPTPPPVQPTPQPQPASPAPAPQQQQQNRPIRAKVNDDAKFGELNRLLALGDGVDTFGNTGDMRMGPNIAHYNQMRTQKTGMNFNANTSAQGQGQGQGASGGASDSNPFFKGDGFDGVPSVFAFLVRKGQISIGKRLALSVGGGGIGEGEEEGGVDGFDFELGESHAQTHMPSAAPGYKLALLLALATLKARRVKLERLAVDGAVAVRRSEPERHEFAILHF